MRSSTERNFELDVPASPAPQRFELRFGTARIFGTVFDDRGLPLALSRIELVGPFGGGTRAINAVTTHADARFDFGELAAGTYELTERRDDGPDRWARFTIAAGEARRFDFGSSDPLVHWRGQLRTTGGAPLPVRMRIAWTQLDGGPLEHFDTDDAGAFDALVPSDPLRVSAYFAGHDQILIEDLAVPASDFSRDVSLPGIRPRGSLPYVGTWQGTPSPALRTALTLTRTATGSSALLTRHDHFAYAFVGLEPGQYRLTAYPKRIVGAPPDGLAVELNTAREIVELALDLDDP